MRTKNPQFDQSVDRKLESQIMTNERKKIGTIIDTEEFIRCIKSVVMFKPNKDNNFLVDSLISHFFSHVFVSLEIGNLPSETKWMLKNKSCNPHFNCWFLKSFIETNYKKKLKPEFVSQGNTVAELKNFYPSLVNATFGEQSFTERKSLLECIDVNRFDQNHNHFLFLEIIQF